MKILFVEDEKDILSLYVDLIQVCYPAIQLETAENGRDALDLCNANEFDIVFTDVNMPIMGGLELLNKIKDHKAYKVIITGYLENKDKQSLCDELLMKPIDIQSLKNIIDKFYD